MYLVLQEGEKQTSCLNFVKTIGMIVLFKKIFFLSFYTIKQVKTRNICEESILLQLLFHT